MNSSAVRLSIKELKKVWKNSENNSKIENAKIWGIVRKKYNGEKINSILVDDFSETISIISEDELIFNNIKKGNSVSVIGKPRNGKDIFIFPKIVKLLSTEEEILARVESIKGTEKYKKENPEKIEEIVEEVQIERNIVD